MSLCPFGEISQSHLTEIFLESCHREIGERIEKTFFFSSGISHFVLNEKGRANILILAFIENLLCLSLV